MPKCIEVKDLNIYYDKFHAVLDVNLVMEPHSMTAFVGPLGCGRLAVLCALNRMHKVVPGAHRTGEVLLDGANLYGPGVDPVVVRRVVGMVFQRPNPSPSMSIYENIASGLQLNGKRNRVVLDEAVEEVLWGADLRKKAKNQFGKADVGLSSGQQQRLCITRVTTVQPDVLLMGKPCSTPDPISTLAVEDLTRELKEHYTVAIITYNMQQAVQVFDETAFSNLKARGKPGHLVEIDPTKRIFHNPGRKATEDYITGRLGRYRCGSRLSPELDSFSRPGRPSSRLKAMQPGKLTPRNRRPVLALCP